MPRVSVIIPTYNRAQFITQAIKSVLKQTLRDFELIIIDDGSTDNTKEIIGSNNYWLRYYFQENKGVSAARNLGIRLAEGEYIAFLDSDDTWRKQKLAHQMAFFEQNPEYKICHTNETWYRHGEHLNQKKKHQKFSGWILEQLLPICIVSPSSVVIHREVFNKAGFFDETLPVCEDYDLWLRIGVFYPFLFLDKPLIIKYGGHSDQLSQKYWGIDRFRIQALEKLLQNPALKAEQRTVVVQVFKEKCQIVAQGAFKRDKEEEGNFYLNLAGKYHV
jgi:glycosyltransferase involved in cell wall biosynthesis